jgi:hypothetical protein
MIGLAELSSSWRGNSVFRVFCTLLNYIGVGARSGEGKGGEGRREEKIGVMEREGETHVGMLLRWATSSS